MKLIKAHMRNGVSITWEVGDEYTASKLQSDAVGNSWCFKLPNDVEIMVNAAEVAILEVEKKNPLLMVAPTGRA